MDRTADNERDVVAAILTLHRSGLLDFKAKDGGAQADISIIVDELDGGEGLLRLSRAVSGESEADSGDQVAEDYPIDSATYDLFTKGLVGLYEE